MNAMTEDLVRLGVCIVMLAVMGVLNSVLPRNAPVEIFIRWITTLGAIGFLGAAIVVAVGLVF